MGGVEMDIWVWMVPVLLLILSIIFLLGKGEFLIAGYNTSTKAEKDKYDKKALCRFMGKVCLALAAMCSLMVVGASYAVPWLFTIGLSLFLITTFAVIIYANTGNRFKK